MANKKKKHPGYVGNVKPKDWGLTDDDINAPFKSHGPSTPIKSLLKRAKLKSQRKGYNV